MYLVERTTFDLFDEEAELKRINEAFSDDPDLRDLLILILQLTLANDYKNAVGFCEILNGHSDRNPMEYLHSRIFDILFHYNGKISLKKVKQS